VIFVEQLLVDCKNTLSARTFVYVDKLILQDIKFFLRFAPVPDEALSSTACLRIYAGNFIIDVVSVKEEYGAAMSAINPPRTCTARYLTPR
jgi:hypothetical protein